MCCKLTQFYTYSFYTRIPLEKHACSTILYSICTVKYYNCAQLIITNLISNIFKRIASLSLSYSPLTSNYSMQGPILNIVSHETELGAKLASTLIPYTRVFSICSSADGNSRFYISVFKTTWQHGFVCDGLSFVSTVINPQTRCRKCLNNMNLLVFHY